MWEKKIILVETKSRKEIWVKILPKRKNETKNFIRSVKGVNDFGRNKKKEREKSRWKKNDDARKEKWNGERI